MSSNKDYLQHLADTLPNYVSVKDLTATCGRNHSFPIAKGTRIYVSIGANATTQGGSYIDWDCTNEFITSGKISPIERIEKPKKVKKPKIEKSTPNIMEEARKLLNSINGISLAPKLKLKPDIRATIEEKVIQLKNSFSVEGVPLIKSNRFTQLELDEMKKNRGTTHESHFNHLSADKKIYLDAEIGDQIRILIEQKVVPNIAEVLAQEFNKLPFEKLDEEKADFKTKIYALIGWDVLPAYDQQFWMKFGSAPYSIVRRDSKDKMTDLKQQYGACGMDEIFGTVFENDEIHSTVPNYFILFDSNWKEQHDLKEKAKEVLVSEYSSLDELEDNVVAKKISLEARKFYMDKTKSFGERLAVFEKYGTKGPWIHHPTHPGLNNLFTSYYERGYCDRYSECDTVNIVESWVESLSDKRCKLDYTANKYHPSLKATDRGYKPMEESIERLRQYYLEKLMLEGISSFTMDW